MRQDLSLRELRALQEQGASVVKTPHVGNIYANNLAVAHQGIPLLLLDRNIGRVDKNFHPHRVIAGGRYEQVACGETLISHAVVQHDQALVPPEFFPKGELVADCHVRSLRRAVPHVNARVFTDYFAEHESIMRPILKATAETCLHRWERFVTATGQTMRMRPLNWQKIEQDGIFGLNTEGPFGWVSPNVANIVSNAAIECLNSDSPDVYHLSGPDMHRYISGLMPDILAVWEAVHEALGLPESIRFNLVPIADMRFAVPMHRRDNLDELVDAYCEWDALDTTASERIRNANGTRKSVIQQIAEGRRRIGGRLIAAIDACPDVFYDITVARHLTQYDLIMSGESLYIHPWALSATPSDLKRAMDRLNLLRNRRSRR